ncbi:hypothetical protein CUMW_264150 [Citrus unshiu]|uniref:DUF7903 domain-containing protein n=1 Tax=Citrus unshiu TaxID=55188 RepID=A0A2H5QUZ1_CITUN|nr:hypothetical protein CUMW_264150 [Citrus unshiu]
MTAFRILIIQRHSAIPKSRVGKDGPWGSHIQGITQLLGFGTMNLNHIKAISKGSKTGTGEATIEINLKLRRLVSEIQDGEIDTDSIYNGFKDNLRLIWDHFLSWES